MPLELQYTVWRGNLDFRCAIPEVEIRRNLRVASAFARDQLKLKAEYRKRYDTGSTPQNLKRGMWCFALRCLARATRWVPNGMGPLSCIGVWEKPMKYGLPLECRSFMATIYATG